MCLDTCGYRYLVTLLCMQREKKRTRLFVQIQFVCNIVPRDFLSRRFIMQYFANSRIIFGRDSCQKGKYTRVVRVCKYFIHEITNSLSL